MRKIIISKFFLFSIVILPFQVIAPKIGKVEVAAVLQYQIKEGDAKIITFKIIDLIKEKLFQENNLGEEEEENIVNQNSIKILLNQINFSEEIKNREINLITDRENIIYECCENILNKSGNKHKQFESQDYLNSYNFCKVGFLFAFVKFFSEKLFVNDEWQKEINNFINISYESWEKAKKIILGKSKLFKEGNNDEYLIREIKAIMMKTKEYKKNVKKLNLEEIEKVIDNKYEIEEFNEFD
uniref:Uncharacterized protein n=1 Tax=Meloidogyne enterolobii TaxID=390850 RepID=A0A6V7U6P6_MELEN|nr:unnamed protein product [Meloidogyne enterolobii]